MMVETTTRGGSNTRWKSALASYCVCMYASVCIHTHVLVAFTRSSLELVRI